MEIPLLKRAVALLHPRRGLEPAVGTAPRRILRDDLVARLGDGGSLSLAGADLGGQDLSGLDLHGMNFEGADLSGTDLTAVHNLRRG